MSKRVVDDLKLVEIDIKQRMRFFVVVFDYVEGDTQSILEFAAIDQAGERVMRSLVAKLAEQARFLADIVEDHDGADDIANAITNGRGRVLNGNLVTALRDQY